MTPPRPNRWTAYRREELKLRTHWATRFASHVASLRSYTRDDGKVVEELRWAKPGTGTEAVTYHSVGPRLIVTGDLYDAIYVRAEGLRWWASCNWDYFAEKCVASPEGRGFRSWDEHHAKAHVQYQLSQCEPEQRKLFKDEDGWNSLSSERDWEDFLNRYGKEVFGQECWEIGSIGKTVDWVCKAHLYGLRLAFEQIDAKTAAVAA